MDLDEVFQRSELVVEGRVVEGASGETPEGVIYTDWTIAVERTFWGDDVPARTVRLPGGVLEDGRGMVVPGLPRLGVGEDVVLLLGAASHAGLRVPTGLGQGKYRIVTAADGTRTALRHAEHLTLVDGARTRAVRGIGRLAHGELVARLEAAAQTRAASDGTRSSEEDDR